MLALIIYITGLTLVASYQHNFYRKDYTYVEEYDTFYKLHLSPQGGSFESAYIACDNEGSQLFYPRKQNEWMVVKNLSASLDVDPNTTDVILGIHDGTHLGDFINVNGQPPILEIKPLLPGQDCVIMDFDTGAYKTSPCVADPHSWRLFVCMKVEDRPCPTIDTEYKYEKATKKCYKVNPRKMNWNDAMHTCYMEGGLLAVVDNDTEAKIINRLIQNNSNEKKFFAGFRHLVSGEFYTLKGKKLSDTYENESNSNSLKSFQCGVYRIANNDNEYGSKLYTESEECVIGMPFICEMEAKLK